MNPLIIPSLTDFLESDKKDMLPASAKVLDRDERREFIAARNALSCDRCPDCDEPLDHGTWIPTMTSCYECEECDFSLEYQEPR